VSPRNRSQSKTYRLMSVVRLCMLFVDAMVGRGKEDHSRSYIEIV